MIQRCITISMLLAALITYRAHGQTRDINLQSFIEDRFNTQEEVLNYEEIYERLLLLYENPIDLNTAQEEELISIGILSQTQIASLLQYRTESGRILTPYELLYIEGFNLATINDLLPFITLKSNGKKDLPFLKRVLSERNHYIILRQERVLERKSGYRAPIDSDDNKYLGSPDKTYLRYRVANTGDFSFGFTTEKDAGEQFYWDPSSQRFGTDFWSAHALIERQGRWRKILVGDYQLQFGQGLVFGAGFSVGKGAETVNTLELVNRSVRPYTSVLEGGFLRGLVATYEINPKLSTTLFASSLNQDANIRQGEEETFENYFSSVQLSGFHRTVTEIENRNSINEKVYGLELHYQNSSRNRLGIIAAVNQFSLPILRSDRPYNAFEFSGQKNFNISLFGNTHWQRMRVFSEVAISKSGGIGSLLGLTSPLSKRIDFSIIMRNYDRQFHTIRGSSFSEGSRNINERGIYWGLKYKLNRKFNLAAYYDSFYFPWLRFRVNTPSRGHDYLIRLNYNPSPVTQAYFQFRGKHKDQNTNLNEGNETLVLVGKRKQYLLNLKHHVTPSVRIQSRVQHSSFSLGGVITSGYAFVQDLDYSGKKVSISTRFAVFDSEGQQNRQYVYERDVLFAFSIPGYSGQGIRNYLLISCRLNSHTDVWARIARTTFYDREEIGTGLETIDGNKRTDVKFQIRYKIR